MCIVVRPVLLVPSLPAGALHLCAASFPRKPGHLGCQATEPCNPRNDSTSLLIHMCIKLSDFCCQTPCPRVYCQQHESYAEFGNCGPAAAPHGRNGSPTPYRAPRSNTGMQAWSRVLHRVALKIFRPSGATLRPSVFQLPSIDAHARATLGVYSLREELLPSRYSS